MPDSSNPYEPPKVTEVHLSWWQRLFHTAKVSAVKEPVFEEGDRVICEGIAFFIDPGNPSDFYAGSPSSDTSDDRLRLVQLEALRLLPSFVADNPSVHSMITGRRFVVRILDSYDASSGFSREVVVDPAIFASGIGRLEQDEASDA